MMIRRDWLRNQGGRADESLSLFLLRSYDYYRRCECTMVTGVGEKWLLKVEASDGSRFTVP